MNVLFITAVLLGGCIQPIERPAIAPSPLPATPMNEIQRFPDILDVQITHTGDNTYTIAVTVSSPYDTPARYADGWRVLAPDGTVLGEHTLLHDHAGEQPFTRTQSGVTIPAGIDEITIEGRDKTYGFGGKTLTVAVPE